MSLPVQKRPPWGRIPFDIAHRAPWLRVPFAEAEYRERWRRAGERLRSLGHDAAIVTGAPGDSGLVRYLTNFESYVGQTAVVVTAAGDCAIATNSLMRAEPMHSSIWMTPVQDVRPTSPPRYQPDAMPIDRLVAEILFDRGLSSPRLAIAGSLGEAGNRRLAALGGEGVLHDFSADLVDLMAIKSPAEIELLRRANRLVDEVFEQVRAACRPGVTESRLAGIAYGVMMAGGAEGPCVPMALVAGPRSGLKHVAPSDYRLADGDILFMDFGLMLDGYVTDNSRSGLVGRGSPDARRFLEAAEAMTQAAIAVIRAGAPQSEVDDAAFAVAAGRGFADDYYFRAHGVGTTLFQAPRFNPGDRTPLRAGEVLSLEPMLVRHGYGTACVERTLLVTAEGCEVLDTSPGIWIDG